MKRAHDSDDVILYAVMETSDNNGIYVEFMPQFWLVQNCTLKERDLAQFYFPRRSQQQSRDAYLRFLKQAKFICKKPQDDGKWELRKGRILKLGLGSLEEALTAEKYYSDYFSTTEAENKIGEAVAPTPKKVMRKKKKAVPKTMGTVHNSDSEDDNRGVNVNTISNYDNQFATDTQNLFTPNELNNFATVDMMEESMYSLGNQDLISRSIQSTVNSLDTLPGLSGEVFVTLDVPIANDELSPEGSSEMDYQVLASGNTDLQNSCAPNGSCCKGHQKILNKIDYVQKKLSKELGLLRQETSANRKLLLQLVKSEESKGNGDDQAGGIQVEPVHVDIAEADEFIVKYKETFPITDSDFLIDFNKSLKQDQKFADSLFAKLDQIIGDDETKTARKILKELCHFRCLKDFTWLGTKKMKSFQDLHLFVEMITRLLQGKYPKCNPMAIITKVVQQRTKSAKEAWLEYLKKLAEEASLDAQVHGPGDDANNKNTSQATEEEVVSFAENRDDSSVGAEEVNETFGVPQSYVYGSPYLGAATTASAAGLVQIPATQLSHAAAIAAATNQFYEYQNAVAAAAAAPYQGQYAGYDPYSSAVAAGAAANYMAPYTYTTLPQSAGMAAVAAANGIHSLSPYQGAGGAALQEARLQ